MNEIYENRIICYNSSTREDEYVKEWVENGTTLDVIKVALVPSIGQMEYTVWNDTHFEWCGPMIMIVQYFAKYTNTRFVLKNSRVFLLTSIHQEYS